MSEPTRWTVTRVWRDVEADSAHAAAIASQRRGWNDVDDLEAVRQVTRGDVGRDEVPR